MQTYATGTTQTFPSFFLLHHLRGSVNPTSCCVGRVFVHLRKMLLFSSLICVVLSAGQAKSDENADSNEVLIDIDLPEGHLAPYFNSFPEFAKKINETSNGPYKEFLSSEKYDREACWGYEYNCKKPLHSHTCPGNHTGYVASKQAQLDVFYDQADFGEC